jgi:type IV pilus assembly protein PilQ
VRAALVAAAIFATATPALADRDMCPPGAEHHGAAIDLDFKDAPVHDVLRLLADVGHVNLVVSDEVKGKVTVHFKRVAWDAAACAIAGVHHLAMMIDGNVLLVRPR